MDFVKTENMGWQGSLAAPPKRAWAGIPKLLGGSKFFSMVIRRSAVCRPNMFSQANTLAAEPENNGPGCKALFFFYRRRGNVILAGH
jgi:hypothetical protein